MLIYFFYHLCNSEAILVGMVKFIRFRVLKKKINMASTAPWMPPPDRIIELYEKLAAEAEAGRPAVLDLQWKCPGRRPPPQEQEEQQEAEEKEEVKPETKTNHMDFEDEEDEAVPFSTPTRGRTPGGPKGSARKKTTSLDNVLSNMRRHRIEEKEYAEEQKKS